MDSVGTTCVRLFARGARDSRARFRNLIIHTRGECAGGCRFVLRTCLARNDFAGLLDGVGSRQIDEDGDAAEPDEGSC